MTTPAIRVSHLGKRYQIGALQQRSDTMRDALSGAWQRWLKPPSRKNGAGDANAFWALDDVSFEVQQGEVLGVIGRNGAGKSTLLKVLARITEPTTGEVDLRGRVGSLLEVGTGFHAELSGRENIFLNGAILGMQRREISARFDEIVAFAGVDQFLDTPVKRYSSGMYMRLAFAVAAHLEPEILLVDEVLAVGDAEFQRKCLGKLSEVARDGRTVVFVSHNMSAIKALCSSAILLKNGRTSPKLGVDRVVADYFISTVDETKAQRSAIVRDDVILHDFSVGQDGNPAEEFDGSKPIELRVSFELLKDLSMFRVGYFLTTSLGEVIVRCLLADWDPAYETMSKGRYEVHCQLPPRFLVAGNYFVEVHCSRFGIKDYNLNSVTRRPISVTAPSEYNLAHISEKPFGLVLVDPSWSLRSINPV